MGELSIKTWRDPYCVGVSYTTPKEITFQPGLTVLVGCNGSGKSTLLHNIKTRCKEQDIPHISYDNLRDGGGTSILSAVLGGFSETNDDLGLGISAFLSSEGESIKVNIGRQSRVYKEFVENGYVNDTTYRISQMFKDDDEDTSITTNQRVFLFDAADSGMSIDAVCELKKFFYHMMEDNKYYEFYIIISANEYEMCNGESCFDVNTGKYIEFEDYDAYKKFILKSREKKEKRIDRQIAYAEKQHQKAIKKVEKLKEKQLQLESKIRQYEEGGEKRFDYSWRLNDIKREIERVQRDYDITEEELA